MSVTIDHANKKIKALSPNISGWTLYGHMHRFCGALVYFELGRTDSPRPPDELSESEAIKTAKRLKMHLELYRESFLNRLARSADGLYPEGLGIAGLESMVLHYADWLHECGGYKLL